MNTIKLAYLNKSIEVQGCFPYLINQAQGKVVLRVTASEDDASFEDLHALKDNPTGIIQEYTRSIEVDPQTGEEIVGEWELRNTYEDYNSGEVSISYQNGQYQADVTRMDAFQKRVEQNRADIEYLSIMADIPLV